MQVAVTMTQILSLDGNNGDHAKQEKPLVGDTAKLPLVLAKECIVE